MKYVYVALVQFYWQGKTEFFGETPVCSWPLRHLISQLLLPPPSGLCRGLKGWKIMSMYLKRQREKYGVDDFTFNVTNELHVSWY